jgi:hypothetical protein
VSTLNRIDSGIMNGEDIRFLLAERAEVPLGNPSGKMITDSDEISFVYLFDEEEGYSYYHFPHAVWPLMVNALTMDVDPVLSWNGGEVKLTGFKDELTMLIYNIEGNDNYGEAFSSAVEQAFKSILRSVE